MKSVLIVGSGRLGKGFAGEIFFNAGWNVNFLDKDKRVIDALNTNKFYTVKLYTVNDTHENRVTFKNAYLSDESYQVMNCFPEVDIIMCCLYPEDFEEAAKYLSLCFNELYKINPEKKMTVIAVTNKNHIINDIENYFIKNLDSEETKKWFKRNIAVRDSIIRRSTDSSSNYGTYIETTEVASLLVQKPIYNELTNVKWIDVIDNIEILKDIKVFTINGPHAVQAYYGAFKGYKTIPDACKDSEIKELSDLVHDLAIKVSLVEWPIITPEEIKNLEYLPKAKEEQPDSIYRVAFDPIRKVSNNDRWMGVVNLCIKHNIDYSPYIKALALAFLYENKDDPNSIKLQNEIANYGSKQTIAKYIGMDENSDVVNRIEECRNKLLISRKK